MTIAQELEATERDIEEVEELDRVKDAIESSDATEALRGIDRVRQRRIRGKAVRMRVAAELLGLSIPTVHKWADMGLLEGADDGVRRVTLDSVLAVRPVVLELKELGKSRHLLRAVLDRIDDAELLSRPDLRESLEQMRRGELIDITP